MKKSILTLVTLALMVVSASSWAQGAGTQTVLDGAYVPEHNPTRKVVPYPHLRQADVMWERRIWEYIDLRQKMNQPLYLPIEEINNRKSLFDVMRKAILEDYSLTAYGLGPTQEDDEFRYPMVAEEVDSVLNPIRLRYVENLDTGEKEPVENVEPIGSDDVVAYKIKEVWLFDKQRSERYVRILGIAPVILVYSDEGEVKGKKDLFWLYFPECRYVFANNEVYNLHNESQRMTFDDLFQKRMFSGYIIKEDNVFNRSIADYAQGIDALLESEKIKNDLFIMEHDLWHY
ncbi:MAG: gliding motility protein GldN [Flavobacteriales bacterium]